MVIKPDLRASYKGNLPWLVDNTIFLTIHGSHAYGTNIATSDVDVKGIVIPPLSTYFNATKEYDPKSRFEQAQMKDPDGVIYDIRKFFKLASTCNPNIIEVLFTDESDWISIHPVGRLIIENRDIFLSQRAYYTFFGYAKSQMGRIDGHRKWFKNPPTAPPVREDFGLGTRPILPAEQLAAAMKMIEDKMETWEINWEALEPAERIELQDRLRTMLSELTLAMDTRWVGAARLLGYDDNFIDHVQKENAFRQKMSDWNSYLEWKQNRNPARAALEEKYGYDTKHGMHLVRLIEQCEELMTTGTLTVKRPNADKLLSIRGGLLPYEEMIEWLRLKENELALVYKTSTALPKLADQRAIDALCEKAIRMFHGI